MSFWYWLMEPLSYCMAFRLPWRLSWYLDSYPKVSVLLLAAGLLALLYRRDARLWWFLVPFALSNALFSLAITIRDTHADVIGMPVLLALGTAVILVGFAFAKARRAWPTASFFAAANLSVLTYQGLSSLMLLSGQYI